MEEIQSVRGLTQDAVDTATPAVASRSVAFVHVKGILEGSTLAYMSCMLSGESPRAQSLPVDDQEWDNEAGPLAGPRVTSSIRLCLTYARGYPQKLDDLAAHIDQPRFPLLLRRRSLAMAIISTANSFGGFVFSVIFSYFLRSHVGFAMGIRIGGFICFGCLGLAQVLMHQYPKAKSPTSQTSSKITGDNPAAVCQAPPSSSSTVYKNRPYVLTVLGGFVFNLGLFLPIFNVQLFAREEGFASSKLIGWLLGITDLSSCVGRVVLTYLGDRYGPVRTIAPCALISGVLAMMMFL